jgi:hypothetical protein
MMQHNLKRIWIAVMLVLVLVLAVTVQGQESSEDGDDPLEIFVSYTVLGVSEFKLDDGVYNVDVLVFLQCNRACSDEEIAFDVMGVSGSEGVTIEDRSRDEFSAEYRIRAVLAQNIIDLSRYPFDAHQLNIIIESRNYGVDAVVYVSEKDLNLIDRNVRIPGWLLSGEKLIDLTPQDYGGSLFSRFTMGIVVSRVAGAAFIRSILPALVILMISFLGTFMPDRQQRMGLAGGILLAMLVHHLSVAAAIPAVAYPVYFDAFMLLNDGAILAQFIATIIELILERRGVAEQRIERFSFSALGLIIVLWIIGQVMILSGFGVI